MNFNVLRTITITGIAMINRRTFVTFKLFTQSFFGVIESNDTILKNAKDNKCL